MYNGIICSACVMVLFVAETCSGYWNRQRALQSFYALAAHWNTHTQCKGKKNECGIVTLKWNSIMSHMVATCNIIASALRINGQTAAIEYFLPKIGRVASNRTLYFETIRVCIYCIVGKQQQNISHIQSRSHTHTSNTHYSNVDFFAFFFSLSLSQTTSVFRSSSFSFIAQPTFRASFCIDVRSCYRFRISGTSRKIQFSLNYFQWNAIKQLVFSCVCRRIIPEYFPM